MSHVMDILRFQTVNLLGKKSLSFSFSAAVKQSVGKRELQFPSSFAVNLREKVALAASVEGEPGVKLWMLRRVLNLMHLEK